MAKQPTRMETYGRSHRLPDPKVRFTDKWAINQPESTVSMFYYFSLFFSVLILCYAVVAISLDLGNVFQQAFTPHYSQVLALTFPQLHPHGLTDVLAISLFPMSWCWYTLWLSVVVMHAAWVLFMAYTGIHSCTVRKGTSPGILQSMQQYIIVYRLWVWPALNIVFAATTILLLSMDEKLGAAICCTLLFAMSTSIMFIVDVNAEGDAIFSTNNTLDITQFIFGFVMPPFTSAVAFISMQVLWIAYVSGTRSTPYSYVVGFVLVMVDMFIVIFGSNLSVVCVREWFYPYVEKNSALPEISVAFCNSLRVVGGLWSYNVVMALYFCSIIVNATIGTAADLYLSTSMRNGVLWTGVAVLAMQVFSFSLFLGFVYVKGNLFKRITFTSNRVEQNLPTVKGVAVEGSSPRSSVSSYSSGL